MNRQARMWEYSEMPMFYVIVGELHHTLPANWDGLQVASRTSFHCLHAPYAYCNYSFD